MDFIMALVAFVMKLNIDFLVILFMFSFVSTLCMFLAWQAGRFLIIVTVYFLFLSAVTEYEQIEPKEGKVYLGSQI